MNWPGEFARRLKMLFRRQEFDANLEEEMRLHQQLRREQMIESGMAADAARSAAQRKFGNPTLLKEKSHMSWGWDWLEDFFEDVRYGLRSMLRSPALTAVALLSLALGIGANTAIFSFLDAVMLRSLPVKDPSQLVVLGEADEDGMTDRYGSATLYSYPFYRQMQQKNVVFSDVAAIFSFLNRVHGTIDGREEVEEMYVQLVSGTYFPVLGVQPALGRALTDEDDNTEGDHPVAVVSYAWWKRALAGDPAVLNRKIKLGTTIFNIVGVAPPEFFGTKVGEAPDIWIPLSMMKSAPLGYNGYKDDFFQSMHIIGRLKPGVSREQAASNVNVLYQQIIRAFPDANLNPRNLANLNKAHVVLTPMTTGLRLLLFNLAITIATALIFGIVPALRGTRIELTDALKDGRGSASGTSRSPFGKVLIVAQVAISLFIRSLVNLTNVDTGFNREGVLRLEVDSNVTGLKGNDPRMIAMFQQIEQRVSSLPGVKAASFASFIYGQGSWNTSIRVPGTEANENVNVKHNVIGNGYFTTLQIPLLAGRTFGPQDTSTSHRVAIISESMAKDLFPPGINPIGHHYYTNFDPKPDEDVEVVGIVKDVKFRNLQELPQYIDYIPNPQHPWGYGGLAVRYDGDFNTISNEVQQAIHGIDHTLPISRITTLDEQVARSITNQRLVAQLSAFFGLLAVFLSCIGIYGLMSYIVSRRTNEIGIRIAIGASRANVRWLVMREIVFLVAIGTAVGIPVTLAGSRFITSMLFGMSGVSWISLVASVAGLLLVGLLAGYLPARRASRVDPMAALRYE